MDFYDAIDSMRAGIPIQSLISKTVYQISKEGLLAEGMNVPLDYMTTIEANGEWREVTIIETKEELEMLTLEEQSALLDDAMIHFDFNTSQGR